MYKNSIGFYLANKLSEIIYKAKFKQIDLEDEFEDEDENDLSKEDIKIIKEHLKGIFNIIDKYGKRIIS